ncbi:MAG: PL29 family lyase N-terminal domain-containing protein [Rikenellaceae bacterium]
MKKILFFISIFFVAVGCSDRYDELSQSVDDLSDRVGSLEDLCSGFNNDIESLQTIVAALQNNDFVTSVEPITENGVEIGYIINFSQSGSVTIYHGADGTNGTNGADGNTPIIGVALDSDGVYYWTIDKGDGNSDWLLDANGNKIPTTGADGADGTNGADGSSSVLTVDTYNGKSYWKLNGEWLLDKNGNMVPTTGEDGSDGSDGSDGEDGANGSVLTVDTYNGKTYWKLDGEWLLDDNGNMIPTTGADGTNGTDGTDGADGADGADGQTPKLSVGTYNGETFWMLNGEWLLDENGDMIPTTGAEKESVLSSFVSVRVEDGMIIFTLANGTEFSIQMVSYYVLFSQNDSSIVEYGNGSSSIQVPIIYNDLCCKSLYAKVMNDTYSSVDIYTRGASSTNWGVGINVTNYTDQYIELQAPTSAQVGDKAVLEITAIDNFGNNHTISAIIVIVSDSGLPSVDQNKEKPTIEDDEINIDRISPPTFSPDSANEYILNIYMTGIQDPNDPLKFINLYGTGHADQNTWLELDGNLIGFQVINANENDEEEDLGDLAKADLVFLVDNSGSMSEEANKVAEQLISWSSTLATVMDVNFGCVGYAESAISGAIDMTDVNSMSTYLNRSTGTSRTKGYDTTTLSSYASSYYSGGECGTMALKYADSYFTFRDGANRIYVNLTDEGNQPNSHTEWSVESLNPLSEYYDWGTNKGTVHTVWSGGSYVQQEDPWLMSEYTGGTTKLDALSDFSNVDLRDLPVTGAILNSITLKMELTPDLMTGTHTLTITIKDPFSGAVTIQNFPIIF